MHLPLTPRSFLVILLFAPATHAQLSLSSAVDLAVRNSPRVKMAQAEVEKARAAVSQAKDVYIPAVTVGAGLGNSYGYSTNPPTLFTITSQSLVYNSAQIDAVRSAHSGLDAALFSLTNIQETVAEDAALTFAAIEHDQQRQAVLEEETRIAGRLVDIVEERFNAGRDTQLDLTSARLTAAQFRLSRLRTDDTAADNREHLARLTGIPAASLRVDDAMPPPPTLDLSVEVQPRSAAVSAAYAAARSKQELAFGDSRYRYRPQIGLFLQYNRYATFADSFSQLQSLYSSTRNPIGANEEAYGIQISIPLYDRSHQAKARESAAEASRAFQEAEYANFQSRDGNSKLRHALVELKARAEVASLDREYAQLQLEALRLQLTASVSGGTQVTPKDEQNSRIAEREKYLTVIDTTFQMVQAEITLLRQTGQLSSWLKPTTVPQSPSPSTSIHQAPPISSP